MGRKIRIVEVGARDGLQNERKNLTPQQRLKLIKDLVRAGLINIEIGAFVSSKWVPQMSGTDKVVRLLKKEKNFDKMSVLVPNPRGMEDAVKSGVKEVAIFGACSEAFSKKNINCSIDESFQRFTDVMKVARKNKIKVRGYLSTAFGCPYQGEVKPAQVVRLSQRMLDLGVYEVSIGDTIGVAVPTDVQKLVKLLARKVPLKKVAMHFHDTRGTALANVLASLELGISAFDSSVGGLGGCPYALGASGNLATEDLIYMLEKMGHPTGVDIEALIKIKLGVEKLLGRRLPSHVGSAGLPNI